MVAYLVSDQKNLLSRSSLCAEWIPSSGAEMPIMLLVRNEFVTWMQKMWIEQGLIATPVYLVGSKPSTTGNLVVPLK